MEREEFACTSERTTSLLNVRLLCLAVRVLPHTLIAGSPVAAAAAAAAASAALASNRGERDERT